jgi:hypothetical protein
MMSEVRWSVNYDPNSWGIVVEELNTVRYGYAAPFYWIQMPDSTRQHCITRGKLFATLAVLRMNHPDLKLEQVGALPPPKKRGKVNVPNQ